MYVVMKHDKHRHALKRVKEHCHEHPADWWEHHGKKDKWHDIIMMEMEQLKHKREHAPHHEYVEEFIDLAAACVCAYHEMTCEEKHRGNI